MPSSTASLCGRADALGGPHPLSLPWSSLVGDLVMLGVAHLRHLRGPSCHPSAAFQLGKMGVSHLCWGRRSLFTHLCSHPGKTSQGEL